MRIRATVAAVSGALVLSAFAVPAAQAADASSGKAALSSATSTAAATLNVTFSKMKAVSGASRSPGGEPGGTTSGIFPCSGSGRMGNGW
jgi:hypothetical protein